MFTPILWKRTFQCQEVNELFFFVVFCFCFFFYLKENLIFFLLFVYLDTQILVKIHYIFHFKNSLPAPFSKEKHIQKMKKKKKGFWVLDIWWDFLLCKWNLLKKKKRCDQKILYNLLMKCFLLLFLFFSYIFWIIWIWFSFVRLLNICFLFLTQAKKINVWENIYFVLYVGFCFIVFLFIYNIGEIPGNAIKFYINFTYTIDKLECHQESEYENFSDFI